VQEVASRYGNAIARGDPGLRRAGETGYSQRYSLTIQRSCPVSFNGTPPLDQLNSGSPVPAARPSCPGGCRRIPWPQPSKQPEIPPRGGISEAFSRVSNPRLFCSGKAACGCASLSRISGPCTTSGVPAPTPPYLPQITAIPLTHSLCCSRLAKRLNPSNPRERNPHYCAGVGTDKLYRSGRKKRREK
jgi:hypothetical protein